MMVRSLPTRIRRLTPPAGCEDQPIRPGNPAEPRLLYDPLQNTKPLEASEAHSPAGNATSPPSTNATSAQLTGGPKK